LFYSGAETCRCIAIDSDLLKASSQAESESRKGDMAMDRRLLKVNASHVQLAQERNRRYMTLSMRMFSTRTNLNGVAVTEGFIDKIVEHAQDYVSMPLCADVRSIERGELRSLGHMYDEDTGLFEAQEIGSYVAFMKVVDEDGTVALNGTARVNRRNPSVVSAIKRLYAEGNLNFSFEIEAGSFEELEDGTILIDAADDNDLMAMAVVSTPAYPEAKAISLVASKTEHETENDQTEGEHMNEKIVEPEVVVEEEAVVVTAEEATQEPTAEAAEVTEVAEDRKEDECAEAEVAEAAESEANVEAEVAEEVVAKTTAAEADVAAEVVIELHSEPDEEDDRREREEERREDIDEMRRELEELRRYRDEQIRREEEAEAERMRQWAEERKALLFEFAEACGLSIMDERIAGAIECLDYETLVVEVAEKARAAKQTVAMASRFDDGPLPAGNRNGMFDRVMSE